MKIDFWADFVCPWCYIGKTRLNTALDDFEHSDRSAIQWRAFQLQPHAKPLPGEKMSDFLMRTKDVRPADLEQMFAQVTQVGADAGLNLHMERTVAANTALAHQTIKYVQDYQPKQTNTVAARIFAAHFSHGLDIGSLDVLAQLCAEEGMEFEHVKEQVTSGDYATRIHADQDEAVSLGVTGVPFFTINDEIAIAGAQPVEVIMNALETAWADSITDSPTSDEILT